VGGVQCASEEDGVWCKKEDEECDVREADPKTKRSTTHLLKGKAIQIPLFMCATSPNSQSNVAARTTSKPLQEGVVSMSIITLTAQHFVDVENKLKRQPSLRRNK
jgi:hypothetical protein